MKDLTEERVREIARDGELKTVAAAQHLMNAQRLRDRAKEIE